MTLEDLRNEIDAIDDEIAPLLARRMSLAAQVAAIKRQCGAPILQQDREQAILDRLGAAIEPEYQPALATIYKAIFRASREYQESL